MTIEQIIEKFNKKFNSLGYDHVMTCGCGFAEECNCISGREQLSNLIRTSYTDLLKEIVEEIDKIDTGRLFSDFGEYSDVEVKKTAISIIKDKLSPKEDK